MNDDQRFEIAIIGDGIAGFSTALRLQNRGFRTIVLTDSYPMDAPGKRLQKGVYISTRLKR